MANAARASTKSAFAPEGAWLSVAMLNLVSADGGTMGYQMASASLAPVFALQGRYVQRVTPRLPEPPGPRSGCEGVGPELRLLLLGDSAAAGVGAASQDEALSGRLVGELAQTFRVSWTLVARTGATAAGTARHLERHLARHSARHSARGSAVRVEAFDVAEFELAEFDVAVLSLGLNDVLGRRPLARWLEDVEALAELLRTRFAVRHVLLSGLPPVHLFPAFPQPLRWYLGAAARRFDEALARWAASQPDCEHVPLPLESTTGMLAPDGLHPGPRAYQRWSAELAPRIRARWAPPPADPI